MMSLACASYVVVGVFIAGVVAGMVAIGVVRT